MEIGGKIALGCLITLTVIGIVGGGSAMKATNLEGNKTQKEVVLKSFMGQARHTALNLVMKNITTSYTLSQVAIAHSISGIDKASLTDKELALKTAKQLLDQLTGILISYEAIKEELGSTAATIKVGSISVSLNYLFRAWEMSISISDKELNISSKLDKPEAYPFITAD